MAILGRIALATAAALAAVPSPAAAVDLVFSSRFYPVGSRELLVSDFNEDSIPDVAGLDYRNDALSVALGAGGGILGPTNRYGIVFRPLSAAAGDFDEDGRLDVAVGKSQEADTDIFILVGDGLGSFAILTSADVGDTDVTALETADLDADGHLDLVAASFDRDAIGITRGRGNGSFLPRRLILGIPDARDLVLGDWNGDGLVDVAVASIVLSVLFGDGAGGIMDDAFLESGARSPQSVDSGDFNEDGHPDLVCSNGARFPDKNVFVWLGDGRGGFSGGVGYQAWDRPRSVAPGDFDEDGHLDLACATDSDPFPEFVVFLFGDGSGRFPRSGDVSAPANSDVIAAADLDGDGHLDLIHRGFLSGLYVLLNRSAYALPAALRGNVNAAAGDVANVLFVNGMRGDDPKRVVELDKDERFFIRMNSPPSMGTAEACFALYAWVGRPNETTVTALPSGWGSSAMPMPPSGGRPRKIWNNTGDSSSFGTPNLPSVKAPSRAIDRAIGLKRRITAFLQGIIEDPASPSGAWGVTNGVTVVSR